MNKTLLAVLLTPFICVASDDNNNHKTVDEIIKEFYLCDVRRIAGGNLPTTQIERLAASEQREAESHGKDSFWRDVLKQRKEEDEAQEFIDRLNAGIDPDIN